MYLLETAKLAATGVTLLQVPGEIPGVDFTCFAIKIGDQVFRSMTNWSFICVWHFNYLLFALNSLSLLTELLQTHLQLP